MKRLKRRFITLESECLTINKKEYKSQLTFNSSRIRQDKKIELDIKQEYSGRELYEMIQNADDESSPKIALILTEDNHFHIKNWGERPFTEEGLLSIMRSFLSPKQDKGYNGAAVRPIGNKGLGFRSLLNWSDCIVLHSNGVKCTFSEEIARREWESLKRYGLNTGVLTPEDITSFERERSNNLPLPVLSIPEVEEDLITQEGLYSVDGVCTTDIEVICKGESVIADIEKKLSTLPCSVLLFLKNISHISVDNKGTKREIRRVSVEKISDDCERITLTDNDEEISFVVCRYQTSDQQFEVAVAYTDSNFGNDNYLYSYFPTRVKLNVPAIYHGTFELNASRNHLVDSEQNKTIMKILGETAVKLAETMINQGLVDSDSWIPYSILNFTFADIESGMLNPLADSIKSRMEKASIFPRIDHRYSTLSSTVRLGDKLGMLLQRIQSDVYGGAALTNHILPLPADLFSSDRFLTDYVLDRINTAISKIREPLQELCSCTLPLEERVELIDAIYECKDNNTKFSVLIDAEGEVISIENNSSAYVLSMAGNVVLPRCLSIKSADSYLISGLQKKWNLSIRDVTDKLQKITNAINGDHTAIRRKIEVWSAEEMDYDGMCEVLRWEYQNPTKDSTPFTSDLHLLNRLGERCNACSLIIDEPTFPRDLFEKIDDKWIVAADLSNWREILGTSTDEEALNFLYSNIGLSQRVPSRNIYYGDNWEYLDEVRDRNNKSQIANRYCDNFDAYNRVSKALNYSFVPELDYLQKFTLSEALGLILNDRRVLSSIMNDTIHLRFRTTKTETVGYSYPAYMLRKSTQFSPLEASVIQSSNFGCDIDYEYLEKYLHINRVTQINPLLVTLGARTSPGSLSVSRLYELLSQKVEPSGIQKRYKELREAIRSKKEDESVLEALRKRSLTHVWARFQGKLEWMPIEKVYYWDNDLLPRAILSLLPKLEIGNRVGEESVTRIFGVKLAKDIELKFNGQVVNNRLEDDIRQYLSDRLKYILAFRIGDDVKDQSLIDQSVRSLKTLCQNLHIFQSGRYAFNGVTYEMREGDILSSSELGEMHFYICSSYGDYENALTDPLFCENLNETVCIALRVTSNTMSNYFRNIITHDLHYVDHIAKKDLSPETWRLTLKSLGISKEELNFWRSYSNKQEIKINLVELVEHTADLRDYLLGVYPYLDLPIPYTGLLDLRPFEQYKLLKSMDGCDCSILGKDGLKDYYTQVCVSIRDKWEEKYKSWLYRQTEKRIMADRENALLYIEQYLNRCQNFNELFFEKELEKIKMSLIEEKELEKMMVRLVEEKFDIVLNEDHEDDSDITPAPTSILPEYETILAKYHFSEGSLNQIDVLIAKYRGLEDLFIARLRKYDEGTSINEQSESEEVLSNVEIEIVDCRSVLRNGKMTLDNGDRKGSNSGYKSERSKYIAGKRAEIKTFEAMKHSEDYVDVMGCSRILNKESGKDSLHYDIKYRKRGTPPTDFRYLEVKSGNPVFLSSLEYQFALENADCYDLAIFHDEKVSIVESPFSRSNGNNPLEVQPETYRLTLEWDNK